MIKKKSATELKRLRAGGARLGDILAQIARSVRPGVSTLELDTLARELIKKGAAPAGGQGDEPSFLNYQPAGAPRPYPAALCVSVNDEVVHGFPGPRVLQNGDLTSLDLGLKHDGLFTDAAITVPVGQISTEASQLLRVTEEALARGIAAAQSGAHLSDISAAVEAVARKYGYGLVRDLGGHGVGYRVHEEPMIPNFGPPGEGPVLVPGLVLAIEPMFNLGSGAVKFLADGYTVKTADGSLSAHFEHTIIITKNGPEIITQ